MTVYCERVYDNEFNPDGTAKPNKILGDFEIVASIDEGTDLVKDSENNHYLLTTREVSGYYCKGQGGWINKIVKLPKEIEGE